jgi:hypothetical protein
VEFPGDRAGSSNQHHRSIPDNLPPALDAQVNNRAGEWRFENSAVMNSHGLFTISTWIEQEQQFEPVSHCSILFDSSRRSLTAGVQFGLAPRRERAAANAEPNH